MRWKKFALCRTTVLQWVLSVESALGGYWRRQPCHVKSPFSILEVLVIWQSFGRIEGRGTELIPARSINASGPKYEMRVSKQASKAKFSTLSYFPSSLNDDNSIGGPQQFYLRSRLRMATLEPAGSFKPALLVVDMQEDFCPPVSGSTLRQPEFWRYTYYCEGRLTSSSWRT